MNDHVLLEFQAAEAMAARRGLRLLPYQRVGAVALAKNPRFALLDDPGLGKTMQLLMSLPRGIPVLICCPSVAKWNWEKHARNWRPDYVVRVIDGSRAFRWPRPGEICIVNWEILPPSAKELDSLRLKCITGGTTALRAQLRRRTFLRKKLGKPHPRTRCAADEAHRAKNKRALCTRRWRELISMALVAGGSAHILTGTPVETHRGELYTVLQAAGLGQKAFGDEQSLLEQWNEPNWVASRLREVSLHRRREQVLPDLPAKTREPYVVHLDRDTRRLCDDLSARLRKKGITSENATLEALRHAASDMTLSRQMAVVRKALATVKIPAMVELVEDAEEEGTPLVVFASHRPPLDFLGRRRGWGHITGSEDAKEKTRIATAFQAGRIQHGVACGIKSAGEAIDLFRAWYAIFVDLYWTWAKVAQAEDRLCRPGQTAKGLLYRRLVIDHWVERRVEELVRERQEMHEQSVVASAREA
jgi:SNF2 family DNA or RNA helicase